MFSFASVLLITGLVWGLVLPLAVLVAMWLEPRLLRPEPLWLRRCRSKNPADPASRPCWVPLQEHCPRHDRFPREEEVPLQEPLIA